MNLFEKLALAFLLILSIAGLIIGNIEQEYFANGFVKEDGLIENGTALFFFIGALIALWRVIKTKMQKGAYFVLTGVFIFLAFTFVAGEEISWGQRIFEVESSEFFKENNAQGELNLHNLTVFGIKLNKLLFGQLLSVALLVYLLVIPWFFEKNEKVQKLIAKFYVPLPKWTVTIVFLLTTVMILFIQAHRRWELLEFNAGLVAILILLYPRNSSIYDKPAV